MKIRLDEKFRIVSDRNSIILQEVKARITGKNIGTEFHENVGYYSTITECLKSYKDLLIRESDVTSIPELLNYVKLIDEKIEKILQGI